MAMVVQSRKERLRGVLNKIRLERHTTLEELARFFQVSTATIRRDIKRLEQDSTVLQTVGGGVIYKADKAGALAPGPMIQAVEEKIRIAEYCTELVRDQDDILIGPGTTTFLTGKIMSGIEDRHFRLITSSVELALEAGVSENIRLVLLGGEVWNKYVVDPRVGRGGYFDSCHREHTTILSADGIHRDQGITFFESRLVPLVQAMISVSTRVILVADSRKFGKARFNRVANLDDLSYVVTDEKAPQEYLDLFRSRGIEVHLV
ncbi:hypothetical protein AU468_10715 [Alkalispirochaeta sphaeroplastigenens]|uniref:HTH deoR-type domain-containing protein n=2 Tax=Alkalispirochaeta TaxID=2024958 RepID=A0A2S4JHV3_9SPIO|nr:MULTISPECIES: DeoR/GlpR family DNA-binding transcription regulator [Alkalispirochaeta]POQ99081.1 hypothetical protein AU468_10715 [Alkalispirochaeta sphaeroplastigenens]